MIAYLRYPLVVWVGDPPPYGLVHDTIVPDAPAGVAVGQVYLANGTFGAAPPGSEVANLAALLQQADDAIAGNLTAIAQAQNWLATNTGGNLTTTVLTTAVKNMMQQQITAAQQRNGIIRLLRNKFDATN